METSQGLISFQIPGRGCWPSQVPGIIRIICTSHKSSKYAILLLAYTVKLISLYSAPQELQFIREREGQAGLAATLPALPQGPPLGVEG